jgi:hypothetical protein
MPSVVCGLRAYDGAGLGVADCRSPGRWPSPRSTSGRCCCCVPDADSELLADRPGLLLIADKGYVSAELDDYLHARGAALPRPSYRNRLPRPGQQLAPIRQRIESVYETLFSPGALQSGERL